MYNIPDHPDIESALRTGYPRSYGHRSCDDYDEDAAYDERRERELFDED